MTEHTTKSREQIVDIINNTDRALVVYQDENGNYKIANMSDRAGIMEMAAFVDTRLGYAVEAFSE